MTVTMPLLDYQLLLSYPDLEGGKPIREIEVSIETEAATLRFAEAETAWDFIDSVQALLAVHGFNTSDELSAAGQRLERIHDTYCNALLGELLKQLS